MKKLLYRYALPLIVVTLMTCQDEELIRSSFEEGSSPEASFTYTANYLTVAFASTSSEADSYFWDFGDGTSSTESSPVHTFPSSGTYEVVLKVNSKAGYSSFTSKESIYVAGLVNPFFEYTFLSFQEVVFDASKSLNIKSAKWDFGDGSPEMEGITVTYEYTSFGRFQVKLTATGILGDVQEFVQEIEVGEPLEVIYSYTPGLGLITHFDASESKNVKSIVWNFGDGSAENTNAKVSHTFPAAGTYRVTLTVTGVLDDVEVIEFDVEAVANFNQLKGSDMEAGDAQHWSFFTQALGLSDPFATFGYTDDKPSGGTGACISLYSAGGSSRRLFVYQAVDVVPDTRYRLSANIKLPAGINDANLRIFVVTSLNADANPDFSVANCFLEINTSSSSGWRNPSRAYDGTLIDASTTASGPLISSGGGRSANHIWTAPAAGTGTMPKAYVGFSLQIATGGSPQSNPVRILVDDFKFEFVP